MAKKIESTVDPHETALQISRAGSFDERNTAVLAKFIEEHKYVPTPYVEKGRNEDEWR